MAIITWQNVPIPQFAGVQQGLANASQFLNQATYSGLGAINLIQRHMQDQADRAIMDRMLAVQDPQEYARQMEQGSILGPERGRASLDTLLAAARHQDTLQARADALYKSNRARMIDADRDRISEAANAALTAAILGDPEQGALELMASQGHLDNTQEVYELLFRRALQQDADAARLESARLRSGPTAARFERETLIEGLAGRLFDIRHDPELFEDEIAKLPPPLRGAVRERVWELDKTDDEAQRRRKEADQGYLDNLLGGQTMEGGRGRSNAIQGGPRVPPRTNANGGFTRFGAYNRVVSDGKIPQADGSIVDLSPETVYGKNLHELSGREIFTLQRRLIEATKSADPRWRAQMDLPEGQGTSAMGMYQLTHTAVFGDGKNKGLAQQIWGDDWRNIRLMAPENHERMARRLFEQNRGKDLKRIWAALPEAYRDPEFTKTLTWEEMRTVIASLESGYRPEAFERQVEIARDALNNRRMSPIGLALQQAEQNKDMPPSDVVTEIMKTEGMDLERKEVHDIISKFLEENRELSPAEAGAIFLNTYLDPREGPIKKAIQNLTGQNRINAIVKQMTTTAKAEIKEQQKVQNYLKNLQDAEDNYRLAYRDVYGPQGALAGVRRNPNDRAAARRYQRALARLEQHSQELKFLTEDLPNQIAEEERRSSREDHDLFIGKESKELPQNHADALLRGYEQRRRLRGESPSQALSRTKSILKDSPLKVDAPEFLPEGFHDEVVDYNLEVYLSAANEITDTDTAWDAYQKLKDANSNRDKFQKSMTVDDYQQALMALGYDVSNTLITHRPGMQRIRRNVENPDQMVDNTVSFFDNYVRKSLKDSPTQSVPLASNPNKAPEKVSASETVVSGPDGTIQQTEPLEISKEDLGEPVTVVTARPGAIPKGMGRKVIATFVKDGDSFNFTDGNGFEGECRIDVIDAPETFANQSHAEEARRGLQELIEGREVNIRVADRKSKGRNICQVEIEGQDVGLEMVRNGLAWVYWHFVPKGDPREPELRSALLEAMEAEKGLWSDAGAFPPRNARRQFFDN